MKTIKYVFLFVMFLSGFYACKEQGRFEIGYDDAVPPGAPEFIRYEPLYGGARLFYKIPADKDLLSIDASYTNPKGKTVWFSTSYFTDSLDVYGFGDSLEHVVQLYAVDRAGNKSKIIPVPVVPMEPAVSRVAKSIVLKPGFASFFLDWKNELMQTVNVYADFSYNHQGTLKEYRLIYTSNESTYRWFIRDLDETQQQPISVKVRVEDMYGNITEYIDKGQITLLEDELIPKDKWYLPEPNDTIGGEPMAYLQMGESRKTFLYDNIIDDGKNINYTGTSGSGRTGLAKDGNVPWNVMIDLGDEYEISRIITHQRYYRPNSEGITLGMGYYYGHDNSENIGIYNMYVWDADNEQWEYISQHKILFPLGLSDLEYLQMGKAGDMAYLFPDDPQFSKPTRWFRYEALKSFLDNYTNETRANNLSEITLYGKKKAK
jgi:hypothetical protein